MSYNNSDNYKQFHSDSDWKPLPPNPQAEEAVQWSQLHPHEQPEWTDPVQEQAQERADTRPYAQQVGMPLAPGIAAQQPIPLPENLVPYRGWINLAIQKNNLLSDLTKDGLAAIEKLKMAHPTGQSLTISEREEAMKEYRAIYTNMVAKRQAYTGYIEKQLFAQVMEPEKRIAKENNKVYLEYAQVTLNMRIEEERKSKEANAVQNELALFETHLKNEYLRIATDYRVMIWKEIAGFYQMHLDQAVKSSNGYMPNLREFKGILMGFPLGPVTKFNRQYCTPEQCDAIWSKTPQPNFSLMQEETLKLVDEKFALWANDVAMAKAGQTPHDDTAQVVQEIQQEVAQEVAANTLVGSSGSGVTIIPEGTPIKHFLEVTVIETEEWSKSIIMNWLKYPESHTHTRNRKWSTLNIGQMADALGKYATEKQIVRMDGLILLEGAK